ncbi:amino acid permease [Candidatus Woesearchaeota archaeon]|nr:amino acid permease [Candidatus Woesearchaeota archaeon]
MLRKHKREGITLRRDLGLFDATIAGVGIIVGAGIYVLIGAAAGHAGNGLWISFLISAFVAYLTGLSYAELSSIYSEDSGEYSYVEHTYGKKVAFVVGYLVILSLIIGAAAVALGFSGYLNAFFGLSSIVPIAIVSIILFSLINFIGIRQSIKINIICTILSLLGLIIIIVSSVPKLGKIDYFDIPSFVGVLKASSLIFFAFIGFESVVKLSEETKNPRKNIPIALLLSLGISSLIYILVGISSISTLSWSSLATSRAPLAEVAQSAIGEYAWYIVSVIAIVSTANTVLMLLIAMSRMLYSMSHDYSKLNFLSKINKRTSTPHLAIMVSALATIAFVLVGNIEVVAEITNFSVFIVFTLINLALIKSRYIKHRHEMFREPFNIGKFPLLALVGFATTLLMIFNLELIVIISGVIMTLFGFLFYRLLKT